MAEEWGKEENNTNGSLNISRNSLMFIWNYWPTLTACITSLWFFYFSCFPFVGWIHEQNCLSVNNMMMCQVSLTYMHKMMGKIACSRRYASNFIIMDFERKIITVTELGQKSKRVQIYSKSIDENKCLQKKELWKNRRQ